MTSGPLLGRSFLAIAFAALLGARSFAQETRPDEEPDPKIAVSGVVVDEVGVPVPGVEVAQSWTFREGKRLRFEYLTTGSDGKFAGELEGNRDCIALVAFTSDDLRAGFVIGARDALRDVKIRLRPSVRVRMSVTGRDTGVAPKWFNTYWSLLPASGPAGLLFDRLRSVRSEVIVLACDSEGGAVDFRAPQGAYIWEVYDQDWSRRSGMKSLDGKNLDVEMPHVRLPTAFVSEQRGKPAPEWNVTATRGAPAEKRRPRDFRGKWLIVEFWGYW